jgi:hypothetical protein
MLDRELLATVSGIKHFCSRLESRPFQLWTDHKPLIFALNRVSPPISGRQQRHLAFISEYTNHFVYVPDKSNVIADALSRPPVAAAGTTRVCAAIADRAPLDLKDMALCQILYPKVHALRSSPGLRIITQKVGDLDLIGDSSTGTFRPLVPRDLRRQVFEHFHGTAHPGMQATRRLIPSRYVWKGLSTDVTAWAKACLDCQYTATYRYCRSTSQYRPPRFSHIHVDLAGPLPAFKEYTHLFTIVDRMSCWPEAIPIAATSIVDCAKALVQGWVSRFGVPAVITSDRGAQFTSSLWAVLCGLLNIQHSQTTAYHPQSNGMVEHFHRRLKDALRARCAVPNWVDHLPWVLLGLRAAAREDYGTTPAQAVFGSPVTTHFTWTIFGLT